MRTPFAFLAAMLAFGAVVDASAAVTREELKEVLDAHPDLVMDVLRSRRKELLEVLNQAVADEREKARKEAEIAAEKEVDEAILHPLEPAVGGSTRMRGNKKAKYTLVEYSDFQCPYCARGYMIVEELRKKYGKALRFVFKNKPLEMHPEAMPAARYFEAISLQSEDKAWQFHDKLFQGQERLGAAFYEETAKELGVDLERLKKDLDGDAVKEKIKADIAEADKLGFSGTPGFLLNGVPVRGAYPVEHFEKIVAKLEKKDEADRKR